MSRDWGSPRPLSGRGARMQIARESVAARNGNGRPAVDTAPLDPSPHERRCPRCRHRWTEGGGPEPDTWPALALEYVAPLLSVPPGRMGLVRALVATTGREGSVGEAVERIGLSRRTLTRRLRDAGLPVAIEWIALGRGERAAEGMMRRFLLSEVARESGISASFEVANHLDRHFGVWPTDVREAPDPVWRWLADRWLDHVQEAMSR